jgi:RsiW-degrading membrane proteinase PrsW (M82 family)
MILKIFSWGMLCTLPVILLEFGILEELSPLISFSPLLFSILYWFLGVALVEEIFKYLVVRGKALKSSEMDEPLDIMLYMIIAGLGFAALENILILFPLGSPLRLLEISVLFGLRFVGATFLHALCSGLVGYFLAISFRNAKNRVKLTLSGLAIATALHGLFNFSIITIEGPWKFIIPAIILISLAFAVSLGFQKLKKMKSVCLSSIN